MFGVCWDRLASSGTGSRIVNCRRPLLRPGGLRGRYQSRHLARLISLRTQVTVAIHFTSTSHSHVPVRTPHNAATTCASSENIVIPQESHSSRPLKRSQRIWTLSARACALGTPRLLDVLTLNGSCSFRKETVFFFLLNSGVGKRGRGNEERSRVWPTRPRR